MPTGRERRYKSLLKWLIVAADREDRKKDYRDSPAKDPYGKIELI